MIFLLLTVIVDWFFELFTQFIQVMCVVLLAISIWGFIF